MSRAKELHQKRREAGVLTLVKESENLVLFKEAITDLKERRLSYRERKLRERAQMLSGVEDDKEVLKEVKVYDSNIRAELASMKDTEDKFSHLFLMYKSGFYLDSILLRTMLIDLAKMIDDEDLKSARNMLSSINIETREILDKLNTEHKEWYEEIKKESQDSSQKNSQSSSGFVEA